MKDKLISLMRACINDEKMLIGYTNGFKRIGVHLSSSRLTLHQNYTTYKGNNENVYCSDKFQFEYPKYSDSKIFSNIQIEFEKEPTLKLIPFSTLISTNHSIIDAKLKQWFWWKPIKLNFQLNTYEIKHEIICGEYKFPVDDELINEFVDLIGINKFKFKTAIQEREINERLSKYGIK